MCILCNMLLFVLAMCKLNSICNMSCYVDTTSISICCMLKKTRKMLEFINITWAKLVNFYIIQLVMHYAQIYYFSWPSLYATCSNSPLTFGPSLPMSYHHTCFKPAVQSMVAIIAFRPIQSYVDIEIAEKFHDGMLSVLWKYS